MRIVPLIAWSLLVVAQTTGASHSGPVGTASIDYTQVLDSGEAPDPLEEFGWSVAQRGDWMFVGAIGDNTRGEKAGRVDVYKRIGGVWTLSQVLLPPAGFDSQFFGTSVVIGDGFAAVGGSGLRDALGVRSGGVHVYAVSGDSWTETAVLQPVLGSDARFGRRMVADGTRLAIGAPTFVLAGPATGHVFVYERGTDASQWTLVKQITRTATDESRPFGFSIALQGDVLVGGDNRGGTWVYERNQGGANQWGLVQPLDLGPIGGTSPFHVAVDNGVIAAGVVRTSADNGHEGEVRLYTRGTGGWTLARTIARLPPIGEISRFGTAVAMSNGWLMIGGSRFHQNPATFDIDVDDVEVRYYRRDASGAFTAYGETTIAVPVAGFPQAIATPIVLGEDNVAIGVSVMPGLSPPPTRYAGAVFVVPTQSLPVFIGSFE